jgi:hypothetical protein
MGRSESPDRKLDRRDDVSRTWTTTTAVGAYKSKQTQLRFYIAEIAKELLRSAETPARSARHARPIGKLRSNSSRAIAEPGMDIASTPALTIDAIEPRRAETSPNHKLPGDMSRGSCVLKGCELVTKRAA